MMNLSKRQRDIYVYADWQDLNIPVLMGILSATFVRGKEVYAFEYEASWLKQNDTQILDPDLQFYNGTQYLNNGKNNFGLFLDSAPDRWGRLLMRRREAVCARAEGRQENRLIESDYLLGVYDGCRIGALRFKEDLAGPFLNDEQKLSSPPWTSLRELEHASLQLEKADSIKDPEYQKWLSMLIAPGASLGGARPKASVIDLDHQLWIAKFPSVEDERNIAAWEMVVNELASQVGINVAKGKVQKFSSRHHTFLTKRFDRMANGQRVHFASAMTMLGYNDGQNYQEGVSYLEMVDFLTRYGTNVRLDLEELFRRIAFYICVSNTDDHLRNHGFILSKNGWILSPAYDVNPEPYATGLQLNISENDNSLDLRLLLELDTYFQLTDKRAKEIINTVRAAVKNWRHVANKYGLTNQEQETMVSAFRITS